MECLLFHSNVSPHAPGRGWAGSHSPPLEGEEGSVTNEVCAAWPGARAYYDVSVLYHGGGHFEVDDCLNGSRSPRQGAGLYTCRIAEQYNLYFRSSVQPGSRGRVVKAMD